MAVSTPFAQANPQIIAFLSRVSFQPAQLNQAILDMTEQRIPGQVMAGINQTTMMALSMVVVASMIGARGLGEDVLAGIQTLDIGRGLQAGVAIVILAIVIDRITQAYGEPLRKRMAIKKTGAP